MRVLVLLTRVPVPPWRGDQVRAYHLVRELATRHQLTLCVPTLDRIDAAACAEVRRLGVDLEVLPLGLGGALPALVHAAVGRTVPGQVALFDRPHARRAVHSLCQRLDPDVVHAQLVRTGPYALDIVDRPVVMDLVDALSSNFARRAAREGGIRRWLWRWEARRLLGYERRLVAHAGVSLVVGAADRDAIGMPEVRVVPNGVDTDRFAPRDMPRVRNRIVFAGNLGYFPNVDAAQWLAREIFPRIRERCPDATLRLVGARPTRAVQTLSALGGVTVVPNVPDVATELAAASLVIAPVRAGSGMQNKVLEALAVGTPIVATAQAAGPLGVEAAAFLEIADDEEGMAAAAVRLLSAGTPEPTRCAAAARFVRAHFRWAEAACAVEAAWEEAVTDRR